MKIYVPTIAAVLFAVFLSLNFYPELTQEEAISELSIAQSKFIDVEGIKVHYTDEGEGEALVLLHGLGGNLQHFSAMTENLTKHFRVITVDYLGHGLTGGSPDKNYSNESFVSFFESFFNALELNNFHVVGNSMGGYLSLLYAQKFPQQVNQIVLIDAYGGKCPEQEYGEPFVIEKLPLMETMSSYILPKFVVAAELKKFIYKPEDVNKELINLHHNMLMLEGNRSFRKYFFSYPHPRDAVTGVGLDGRIHFLWGKEDVVHNLCEADNLALRLNPVSTTVLPEVGHLPMLESPKESETVILKLLKAKDKT